MAAKTEGSKSPKFTEIPWVKPFKLLADRRYFYGTLGPKATLLPGTVLVNEANYQGKRFVILDIGSKTETPEYNAPGGLTSLERKKVVIDAPVVEKKHRGRPKKAKTTIVDEAPKEKGKRHRRTKAEILAAKGEAPEPKAPKTKKARKRRTKAEMELARSREAKKTTGKRGRPKKA